MRNSIMLNRYAVVFCHDSAPVDGCLFSNKAAAIKIIKQMKKPHNYRVAKFVMQEVANA